MDEDLTLERAVLCAIMGPPNEPTRGGWVFLGWGKGIDDYYNAIAVTSPNDWGLIGGGAVRKDLHQPEITERGSGWLLLCPAPIWPPMSFEEIVTKLKDPEFRKEHNIDQICGGADGR